MSTSMTEAGGSIVIDDCETLTIWSLLKVPDHLRKQYERALTPQLIPIGPIHHSNSKLQTMKKCKERFRDIFLQRANLNLQDLLDTISGRVEDIRSFYGKTLVSSISNDDLVAMILVDGMFILEYILSQTHPYLVENDPMIAEWMAPILKLDLVLLENQLPFFVLDMLLEQGYSGGEYLCQKLSLMELALKFFRCYDFQMMGHWLVDAKIEHFTDLVRLLYLGGRIPYRIKGKAILLYTATQLHETGVKFKQVSIGEDIECYRGHGGFLDIRFNLNNGVLEIPCIKLNDEMVRLIQNIIALEQSLDVTNISVTDFFVFLDFLIKTRKDVDLLCNKGIVVNYLGDSNTAASTLSNLKFSNTNISGDFMNAEYLSICKDLNAFCNRRWQRWEAKWYRWREILWVEYFSTPWRAASTSGAIILLVLTAIQTVCSLKSIK